MQRKEKKNASCPSTQCHASQTLANALYCFTGLLEGKGASLFHKEIAFFSCFMSVRTASQRERERENDVDLI